MTFMEAGELLIGESQYGCLLTTLRRSETTIDAPFGNQHPSPTIHTVLFGNFPNKDETVLGNKLRLTCHLN